MAVRLADYGEEEAGRVAVGIDPSRAALQIASLSPHGDQRRERRVPLGPAAVAVPEGLVDGHDATIAFEGSRSTGQLFLLELRARGHDVRGVQPVVSKRFRQALSEDHTDRKDAAGLALLARWMADLPAVPFSEAQATCKRLTRVREQVVRDRTRYVNRLHAALSEGYGAPYNTLFADLPAKKALRFFAAHPTLHDALDTPEVVAAEVGADGWTRLAQAGRWREGVYLDCLRLEVRTLVTQVLALKERAAELDRAMNALPLAAEVELLMTMPRVGLTTAPVIVGDSGDVARFGDVHRYVAYGGLAPATHQSGARSPVPKPRHRYNRHLKRALLLLALAQMRWCAEARAYYDSKRAEGKRHRPALRCLARQLCRIACRMLAQGRPYRERKPRDPEVGRGGLGGRDQEHLGPTVPGPGHAPSAPGASPRRSAPPPRHAGFTTPSGPRQPVAGTTGSPVLI